MKKLLFVFFCFCYLLGSPQDNNYKWEITPKSILASKTSGLMLRPGVNIKTETIQTRLKSTLNGSTLEAFVIDNITSAAWNFENTATLYKNAIHPDSIVKTVNIYDGKIQMEELFLGIKDLKLDPNNFNLYPNPASQKIQFSYELTEPANMKIQLFNTIGQVVGEKVGQNQNYGQNDVELRINNLADGHYYAKIVLTEKGGEKNGTAIIAAATPYVNGHEVLHVVFAGGNHSPYIEDMFHSGMNRFEAKMPLPPTLRELKGIKTLYDLERNTKLNQWFK